MLELQQLDEQVFHLINSDLQNSFFDLFFPAITDLHKFILFWLIVLPLIFFIFKRNFSTKAAATLFVHLLFCLMISDAFAGSFLKPSVARPRPIDIESLQAIQRSPGAGYGFPSNHSSNMFALATFLFLFHPVAGGVTFVFAFLVGLSRIYNGLHFPSDVIAGALLGIFWAFLFAQISKLTLRIMKESRL